MQEPEQRQSFKERLIYKVGYPIWFCLLMADFVFLLVCAGIPAIIWLKHAEFVDFDIFAIYTAISQKGWSGQCLWPLEMPPLESAKCHALAEASFRRWAVDAEIWKGVATIVEWLGDLWLGWYAAAALLLGWPKN